MSIYRYKHILLKKRLYIQKKSITLFLFQKIKELNVPIQNTLYYNI